MRRRYLLAAQTGAAGSRPCWQHLADATGLALRVEQPRAALLTTENLGYADIGRDGIIVGTLFHRHGPARAIESGHAIAVSAPGNVSGEDLIASFWGGYVALLAEIDGPVLLRDPSGALPCYLAHHDGCMLAASDVDLLIAAGVTKLSIDCPSLAFHLYSAGLPRGRTVLSGVDELLPGFSVDISHGKQRCRWSPWDHAALGNQRLAEQNEDELIERLRRVVVHSIASWASSSSRILLSVSGGLDSSIVAACLAGSKTHETHCLTMFGDDAAGDERDYARTLCKALKLPLTECRYRVEDVDLDAPLGAHLPRPFGRSQAHAYEQAHLEVARSIDADTFMTGNGGDNVFAYSQSAAAATDRLQLEGLGLGTLRTLSDISRQTGCSMLAAARAAAISLRGRHRYLWRPSTALLDHRLVAELAAQPLDHDWLDAPAVFLPGKAGHIAGLLRVQPNLEPGRSRYAPVLNPLVSQPVMEACLGIPSWRWRTGGYDRAIARAAFRGDLPDLITNRRGKGGPDGFTAQIVIHHRAAIRERLLDGLLAAERLIDTVAIERLLSNEAPTMGDERSHLLGLVSAEAWLRYWTDRVAQLNRRPVEAARA